MSGSSLIRLASAAALTMIALTEDYERHLWEELNALLADVVPQDTAEDEAERSVMLAIMDYETEVPELHEMVWRLARERPAGYLRVKLDEKNLVSRARRRLYGKWA